MPCHITAEEVAVVSTQRRSGSEERLEELVGAVARRDIDPHSAARTFIEGTGA